MVGNRNIKHPQWPFSYENITDVMQSESYSTRMLCVNKEYRPLAFIKAFYIEAMYFDCHYYTSINMEIYVDRAVLVDTGYRSACDAID